MSISKRENKEIEMTYKMIVKTDSVDSHTGRATHITEHVRNIPADQLSDRREAARQSAPRGSTRTIQVVQER